MSSGSSRPRKVFVATSYAGAMLFSLLIGYRGGRWLDDALGTSLFALLGIFLGLGLSLGVLFREAASLTGRKRRK